MRWLDGITNGHELGQIPGDGEGQGSLACCSPSGHEESAPAAPTSHGFFLPFLFLSGFLPLTTSLAPAALIALPLLAHYARGIQLTAGFPLLSCIHGRHSDSLWATDPQETLQEEPGLQACTSDPCWGPDTLNFSSMPSASQVRQTERVPANLRPLDC